MQKMLLAVVFALAASVSASAGPFLDSGRPVFTQTLNNIRPLEFGMGADEAAFVLRAPLNYLRGKPGDETFLVFRSHGGSGLFPRSDRLFLRFRHGRLTGLKGDWGDRWMWR